MTDPARPLKLLYVNPQSYNNLSKYDRAYLFALTEIDINYACSTLLDQRIEERIFVHQIFSYNSYRTSIAKSFSYMWSLIRLARLAKNTRPDIVHIQWTKLPFLDFLLFRYIRKFIGARIVYTAHNVVPHDREDARHFWLGRLYRLAHSIIVHEEGAKRAIAARFSVPTNSISVIRHGLIPLEPKGAATHQSDIDAFYETDAAKFCFFGFGKRYKGLDLLLDAWLRVHQKGPGKSRLLIAGRLDPALASHAKSTQNNARDHLMIIDEFLTEADLYRAVGGADLIVFPYRRISQSGALLSTLPLRVPVLVTELPGFTEPLSFGHIGYICKPTVESLTEALLTILDDRSALQRVKEDDKAWDSVLSEYRWESIADRAAFLYRCLVSGLSGPLAKNGDS